METGSVGFAQLLENGALGLKGPEGTFTTEFSAQDLDGLVRSILRQSEAEMKRQGVTAQINALNVAIEDGKGGVAVEIAAAKKVAFVNVPANISAAFALENVNGPDGQPSGKLRTTQLDVAPESLFGIVKPRDFLAPYVESGKINDTLRSAMDVEMDKRGARITDLYLAFTPENKLKIAAKGSAK